MNTKRKSDIDPSALLGGGLDISGRQVEYFGEVWTVTGKNYLGDWDVERPECRPTGPVRVKSSIDAQILPEEHPHYARLLPVN